MKKFLVAGLCAALLSQTAFAQSSNDPLDTRIFKNGIWLGGGGVWTNADGQSGTNLDDDAFGFDLSVGYQFLNYFGVNATYYDLGEFKDNGIKIDTDGYALDFAAGYPLTGRIAITGIVGYYDFSGDISGFPGDADDDGLRLGVGLASEIGRVVVRPRVVWYDSDADLWSLELNFAWKIEIGN
jgi:hypothetical protein